MESRTEQSCVTCLADTGGRKGFCDSGRVGVGADAAAAAACRERQFLFARHGLDARVRSAWSPGRRGAGQEWSAWAQSWEMREKLKIRVFDTLDIY